MLPSLCSAINSLSKKWSCKDGLDVLGVSVGAGWWGGGGRGEGPDGRGDFLCWFWFVLSSSSSSSSKFGKDALEWERASLSGDLDLASLAFRMSSFTGVPRCRGDASGAVSSPLALLAALASVHVLLVELVPLGERLRRLGAGESRNVTATAVPRSPFIAMQVVLHCEGALVRCHS